MFINKYRDYNIQESVYDNLLPAVQHHSAKL